MASAERFGIYPASFTFGEGPPTILGLQQIENFDVASQPVKRILIPAGSTRPAAYPISHADPAITFSSRDVETTLTAFPLEVGLKLTGANTFRMQERTDCGEFETGPTQETWDTTNGYLHITAVSAAIDDEAGAKVDMRHIPFWNGIIDPIVHNTGIDFLTAPPPGFVSQYFQGPVYINAVELPGVLNFNIEPNINFSAKRHSGNPFARNGAIMTIQPRITITIDKVDETAALSLFGRALPGAADLYLWKGGSSIERVDIATPVHAKITAPGGDWSDETVSVSGTEDGNTQIQILPLGPLAVSVASAIPAIPA